MSKKASGGPERKPIGVFVLEDQEIVRRGVRVSVLFVKLGMKRRTQAAAYAARTFGGRTFELSQDMRIINRSLEPRERSERSARRWPGGATEQEA